MAADVHVEDWHGGPQQVIVDGAHFEPFIQQLFHHRTDLGIHEHVGTPIIIVPPEGMVSNATQPPSAKAGLMLTPSTVTLRIGTRESIAMDFPGWRCPFSAENLIDWAQSVPVAAVAVPIIRAMKDVKIRANDAC
jgi:hypothetical protein